MAARKGGKAKDEHPMRVPDALWEKIGDLAESFGYSDGRGVHAPLARDILDAAVTEWYESPYICRSARHSFLVTRDGDIFYRQYSLLYLNTPRERLPCAVEMKREKRDYYFSTCPKKVSTAEWFKSRWLINGFGVWLGEDLGESPLAIEVDPMGTDIKSVDLLIKQPARKLIGREVVVAARDYVQWAAPGVSRPDWVEIPVDVPTRSLEVEVFVDEELYRNSSVSMEEISDLYLQFRNRESAQFANNFVVSRTPPIDETKGRFPDRKLRGGDLIHSKLKAVKERFEFFAGYQAGGKRLISEEEENALRRALITPEKFLYYRLGWEAPHLGIQVCVGWDRPVKG